MQVGGFPFENCNSMEKNVLSTTNPQKNKIDCHIKS